MITHKKMIQTVVLIMSIVIVFIAFCPYIQASAFIAFSNSNGKRYSFSKDDLSLIYQLIFDHPCILIIFFYFVSHYPSPYKKWIFYL